MEEAISKEYAKKLSHDLKAPLSALKVLADTLSDPDQKELLEQSIQRYEDIIKSLQKNT
jgi:K+-sensing histidine kinase KdpD